MEMICDWYQEAQARGNWVQGLTYKNINQRAQSVKPWKDPGPPPPPTAHNKTSLGREVGFLHLANEHTAATLLHTDETRATCSVRGSAFTAEEVQSGEDQMQAWWKQTTL